MRARVRGACVGACVCPAAGRTRQSVITDFHFNFIFIVYTALHGVKMGKCLMYLYRGIILSLSNIVSRFLSDKAVHPFTAKSLVGESVACV